MKGCRNSENALSPASPTGEGAGCSRFCGFRRFEKQLGFATVDAGRLKNKKQPAQPVFLAEPFIPTATPSSLPWERARERATSRKACIWAVRVLGKIAAIRGMPSPQPSPAEEGVGCSRFKRCRSSEKEFPKHQQQEFFRQPLSQGRWNKRRERFQTTFEPIGRVCAARHARGGLRLQGKWRTRACVPHTPYMRAMAYLPIYERNIYEPRK